ncbi:hypothetical protein T484DRAFT_3634845, partial [Baffinella frigidus]
MCGAKVPTLDLGGNVGCCSTDTCGTNTAPAPTCVAGQYSNGFECNPCPLNTYSSTANTRRCTSCASGGQTQTTGSTQASQCIMPCPPGSFKENGGCTLCGVDSYSDVMGFMACTACPTGRICIPGEYFNSDSKTCWKCAIGTLQGLPGQTFCRTCPVNHTTASLGGAIYTDCVCPAGSYKDSYDFCEPCPEGSVS